MSVSSMVHPKNWLMTYDFMTWIIKQAWIDIGTFNNLVKSLGTGHRPKQRKRSVPSGIFWSLFHCRIFGIAVLRVILKERCCALLPKARHSGPFLVFSMLGETFFLQVGKLELPCSNISFSGVDGHESTPPCLIMLVLEVTIWWGRNLFFSRKIFFRWKHFYCHYDDTAIYFVHHPLCCHERGLLERAVIIRLLASSVSGLWVCFWSWYSTLNDFQCKLRWEEVLEFIRWYSFVWSDHFSICQHGSEKIQL